MLCKQMVRAGSVSLQLRSSNKRQTPCPGNRFEDGGHHGLASPARRESADDRRDAGRAILAGGSRAGGSADQPHSSLPTAPADAYRRGSGAGGSAARAPDQSARTCAGVAGRVLPRHTDIDGTHRSGGALRAVWPGSQTPGVERGEKISQMGGLLHRPGRRVLGVCSCSPPPTKQA